VPRKLLHATLCLTFVALNLCACAMNPFRGAKPDPEPDSPLKLSGGMNDQESDLCADQECHDFIAPCTLLTRNKGKIHSDLDEVYLNQVETFTSRGYCAEKPRPLANELYSQNTCLFLFVKKVACN
jgi:hypothetical protein